MGGVIQRIPRRLSRGILRISLAVVTALLISMVLHLSQRRQRRESRIFSSSSATT
jgi:hypothetical protein